MCSFLLRFDTVNIRHRILESVSSFFDNIYLQSVVPLVDLPHHFRGPVDKKVVGRVQAVERVCWALLAYISNAY